MSEHAARSVLSRIHQREMAVAAHYTGLASDLRALATANQEQAEQAFMARRAELVAAYGLAPVQQSKPFAFSSGIAVIPVQGTLINRFGYSWSFVTGYNFIRQQTALAGQDPDVIGIIYDANSYGGEVAGCFETAADLKPLANGKPTMTLVDSNCYSACYAMACGTDKIVMTPSGGAGSVGVVAMHVSYEQMLAEAGIKITFIHAGDHKVDGNPYQDLSAEVKADIQASIDAAYDTFVAFVAKGRGMDEKAVRDTQARTYRAQDALSLGLIDAIATPQAAVRGFLGELSGSTSQLQASKEDAMSEGTKPGATTATPEQLATAQTEARNAERARVASIQNCDAAKGRAKLASHLAFNTSMSLEEATAILAAAPAEAAANTGATTNAFKAAMESTQNPNVGAEGAETQGEQSVVQRVLAAGAAAGVIGFVKPKTA